MKVFYLSNSCPNKNGAEVQERVLVTRLVVGKEMECGGGMRNMNGWIQIAVLYCRYTPSLYISRILFGSIKQDLDFRFISLFPQCNITYLTQWTQSVIGEQGATLLMKLYDLQRESNEMHRTCSKQHILRKIGGAIETLM